MSENQNRVRIGIDVDTETAVLIKALAKLENKTVQELLEPELVQVAERGREEIKRRLM